MGPGLEEGERNCCCPRYSGMMRCEMYPRASRKQIAAFGAFLYARPSPWVIAPA